MKNLLLSLFLIAVTASIVWALPDNVTSTEVSNGSVLIKNKGGFVYSLNVNYIGVTAGDKVQLVDGQDGTGTPSITCVAASASGNCSIPLTVGAVFNSGIYYKETKSGGNFISDIQYF